MTYSAPTLPHPTLINGLNHIPPPPVSSFDAKFSFSNLLPPGTCLSSSWGTTRYYDFGAPYPSSRRVLIVHGGGTCAIGIAPFAHLLKDAGNHVMIYDLYGHGLSSTPLVAHTPALMHMQILELLSHLGWSKVNLIGYSMGGSISTSFTALHQNAVESLVAVAPAGLWKKSERSWWEGVSTDGFGLPGLEWLRRSKILSYIYGNNPILNENWQKRMLKGEIDTVPIQKWEIDEHKGFVASLTSCWNYLCFDQQDMFRKVMENGTDVLVVVGGKDGVIEPDHTKMELGKMGWKGEVLTVEGATHNLIRAQRNEVAAICTKFWEGLEK
jgi:pimeloyl-ACP methyl ester carboxylesterase